jgi:xylonate dehydratase
MDSKGYVSSSEVPGKTMKDKTIPSFQMVIESHKGLDTIRTKGNGPGGRLPLTSEMLLSKPSGYLFGLTQNTGMGWPPDAAVGDNYLILSNLAGLRGDDGMPLALGYHTGHWELGLLLDRAARVLRDHGAVPFAAYCSDPCDGRTQGTYGMFDSLAYRNDAAITMRRLIRSLPEGRGVLGIGTCDKGLPALMAAVAGTPGLPGIILPGGVTLPAIGGEDNAKIQSIGARFAHQLIDKEYAGEMVCKACGSAGGGCQFLGTAATAQVVAEARGMALPHSALSPSGEEIWLDAAGRSALALLRLKALNITTGKILTQESLENAMLVHAAFGGSTNLLLHLPAIAHAACLKLPAIDDWIRVNKLVPRLVDVLPNGPRHHPTVHVFMAGGVPEVMLHLRDMGLLHTGVTTVTGESLDACLSWWEQSERRRLLREHLEKTGHVSPGDVIMGPDQAKKAGLTSTVIFPRGNIAPGGSVVKATTIDPSLVDEENVYRLTGRAKVFTSEAEAIQAIKGRAKDPVTPGDVIVLIGCGPLGTGMEETYQLTSALTYIPWGKKVPIITDARFSGVSTGACIGHIGPEALAGGAIGRLRDGDLIEIVIDRERLEGRINFTGTGERVYDAEEARRILMERDPHPGLRPHPGLPDDTRLWAALQRASGGIWAGCIYDVDKIIRILEAGMKAAASAGNRDEE